MLLNESGSFTKYKKTHITAVLQPVCRAPPGIPRQPGRSAASTLRPYLGNKLVTCRRSSITAAACDRTAGQAAATGMAKQPDLAGLRRSSSSLLESRHEVQRRKQQQAQVEAKRQKAEHEAKLVEAVREHEVTTFMRENHISVDKNGNFRNSFFDIDYLSHQHITFDFWERRAVLLVKVYRRRVGAKRVAEIESNVLQRFRYRAGARGTLGGRVPGGQAHKVEWRQHRESCDDYLWFREELLHQLLLAVLRRYGTLDVMHTSIAKLRWRRFLLMF